MSTEAQKPYEWRKVIVWTLTLFLWGLTTARSPFGSGADSFAMGLLSGTGWAIIGAIVVAIWKYFKRSSSTISPAELLANDKGLFIVALVLAVFLVGKAIYLETYGALADVAILVGLGIAVKAGIAPARWAFAIYAFVSPMAVVANGVGNAVIWPFVFYYVCRSLSSGVTTTMEAENSVTLSPVSSAPSIKLAYISVPTASNSLPINSIHQPSINPQLPGMPTQSTSALNVPQAYPFDEDAIYEVVANEMESGKLDKGLWTRLLVGLDGDERKTKIAYIKQRAERLIAAEQLRLEQIGASREQAAETAETVRLEELRLQLEQEEKFPPNLLASQPTTTNIPSVGQLQGESQQNDESTGWILMAIVVGLALLTAALMQVK